MYQYNIIYEVCFKKYRKGMRGTLSYKKINNRVRKVLEDLGERDRHLLVLLATYGSVSRIARMEDMSVKKLNSKLKIALNHLVTPANVTYITGNKMFKHTGKPLTSYNFSTRTLNALRNKSNITTDDDLKAWLKYGDLNLFRLPGCGIAAIRQIIDVMYKLRD